MNKQLLEKFYKERGKTAPIKDNHVLLERFVTLDYLKRYIKKNNSVAEVGAGIRAYSPEIVKFAKQVTAIDLFQENLDRLSKQIKHDNFKAICADILDLKTVQSGCFDVVFVNGPLSHLFDEKEQVQAIKESCRICKKGGMVLFNYLTHTPIIYRLGLIKGKKTAFTKYERRQEKDIYETYFVNDFHKLVSNAKLKYVCDVASDGLFELLKEYTNKLNKADLDKIKKMQLKIAERQDMIGCSSHVISVYKKL